MRSGTLVVAALAAALVLPLAAHAEEIVGTARLSQGMDDVVNGPFAVADVVAEETATHGAAAGVPLGLARGVGTMMWREANGVYGIARSLGDADVVSDSDHVSTLQHACERQQLRIGRY